MVRGYQPPGWPGPAQFATLPNILNTTLTQEGGRKPPYDTRGTTTPKKPSPKTSESGTRRQLNHHHNRNSTAVPLNTSGTIRA